MVVSASLQLFLLLILAIYLLRTVLNERESVRAFAVEDKTLLNKTWQIWKYVEGRECIKCLILLIWIKVSNRLVKWKLRIKR